MEITIEMIEQVKDKTGVSYKEAKEALERTGGNVVDAIIDLEESLENGCCGESAANNRAIIDRIKDLIHKGNVSKIVVKKDGDIILNLPVNVGIIGAVVAPWVSVAAVIAAFGTRCCIEVVKTDGSIIDVSEMAGDTFGVAVEKGAVIAEELKTKGAAVYETVKEKGGEAYANMKNKADGADFDIDVDFSPIDDCDIDGDDEEK